MCIDEYGFWYNILKYVGFVALIEKCFVVILQIMILTTWFEHIFETNFC
jgi:hypothetical protein